MKNHFEHKLSDSAVTLGRISYMNVAPVYHRLDNGLRPAWLKMVTAAPSVLNNLLERGVLDISPVSSAAYARNQDKWLLLPNLSISCFGKVMSVILVSKCPLEALNGRKVILTDESATAAELLRLLFAVKKIAPRFESEAIRSPADLQKKAGAALIIGDSALNGKWEAHFDYVWDLGDIWRDMTGLPFVFATWAVRKSFAAQRPDVVASIMDYFRISKKDGSRSIEEIALSASVKLGVDLERCEKYYDKLFYDLDPFKIKGLETFFEGLYRERLISERVRLSFFEQVP